LNKFSPNYKLVSRPSPYDLVPLGRKGKSAWVTFSAIVIGAICIGPNLIVTVRLFHAFYRLGMAALTLFNSMLHPG